MFRGMYKFAPISWRNTPCMPDIGVHGTNQIHLHLKQLRRSFCSPHLRGRFQILYDDNDLIAVNKPAEMLSVPGRGEVALGTMLPRSEEWIASIVATYNIPRVFKKLSPVSLDILKSLLGKLNVPRNEKSFKNYLSVCCHVKNTTVQDELWCAISQVDEALHKVPISSIQKKDLSVSTMLSAELGIKLYTVHRLDLETTGVLVFAKHPEAAEGISKQFRFRETEKLYIAEVSGHVTEESVRARIDSLAESLGEQTQSRSQATAVTLLAAASGEDLPHPRIRISAPLSPNRVDPPRQMVDFGVVSATSTEDEVESEGETGGISVGKPSETIVQVLSCHSRWVDGVEECSSVVLLKPITGRSHQLRVHLQFLGYPILHDRLYCPDAAARALCAEAEDYVDVHEHANGHGVDPAGKLKLHSFQLYLRHPTSQKPMTITAADCDNGCNMRRSDGKYDGFSSPAPFVSIDEKPVDSERLSSAINLLIQ